MEFRENIKDYKPQGLVYGKNAYNTENPFNWIRNKFNYERSWFCKDLSIIHHSEKSVLNCEHCSKKYYL